MTQGTHDEGIRLRRQLRAQLRDGAESVAVTRKEAELLLDELGRLQQSNDRMRRQNRRLRKRLIAAGQDPDAILGEGEGEGEGDGAPAAEDEGS
jgi:hypothetical protein